MNDQEPTFHAAISAARALARSAGFADIERRLQALADGAPATPRAVCVGMPSVGKSRLVNALVGRPLLSPVGDDVVTATYIAIASGAPDRAFVVMADADGPPRRVPVELGELTDYVSVDASHDGVVGAEVYLDTPLLRGLEILDTPGVGGLIEGHNAVTMASLDNAQTLLFVMQPGAPLSAPELRFLAEASRRTDSVVLAMAKIDLHREWRAIRDDNLALIARHVPQLADVPILPVSSKLAEPAATLSAGPEAADRARAASGMNALIGALQTRAELGTAVAADTRRRITLPALLAELRARLAERPGNLAADRAELSAVRAERNRLSAFLNDPLFGAVELNRRIQRARQDAQRDFDLEASALLNRYSVIVETASGGELRELPVVLKGELAKVVTDAISSVDHALADMLDGLESRIGSSSVTGSLREQLPREVATDIPAHRQAGEWGGHTVTFAGATISAAMGWVGLGVLGATVPVTVLALAVASVATTGLHELLRSRTESRRQGLRLWIDRVRREVDRSFDQACGKRLDALERFVNVELPRLLENRIAQIDELTGLAADVTEREGGPRPADVDALMATIGAEPNQRDRAGRRT